MANTAKSRMQAADQIAEREEQQRIEVVWIDNTIEAFQLLIEGLQKVGVAVRPADSLKGGLATLRERRASVVLLDYGMGSTNGLSIVSDIAEGGLADSIYVCSGYSYNYAIMNEIRKKSGQAPISFGFIAKEWLPDALNLDALREFRNALVKADYVSIPEAPTMKSRSRRDHAGETPFPSWETFEALDLAGRLNLLRSVEEATKAARTKYFSEGAVWLLFCGSWDAPSMVVKAYGDVPSDAEVYNMGHDRGFAPLVFSRGPHIDDVGACSQPAVQGYPRIELTYNKTSAQIHLDSGNALTLLGYEYYVEKGWLRHALVPVIYEAGELQLFGTHFDLAGIVFRDARGNSVIGRMRGFAVLEWTKHRICLHCTSCKDRLRYPLSRNWVCKFRSGLLGRSLGQDIERRFECDFVSGDVILRKGEK